MFAEHHARMSLKRLRVVWSDYMFAFPNLGLYVVSHTAVLQWNTTINISSICFKTATSTGLIEGFEHDVCHVNRTAYYTAYRQVYRQDYQTVYKCCSGWSQLNGEAGCLYRKYQLSGFSYFFPHISQFLQLSKAICLLSTQQEERCFKHHLALGTDLWMKDFQIKVKRVRRCFAHPDSSADVISQCHVLTTCVVTTVPQGLDVDGGKRISSVERFQVLTVALKRGLHCSFLFYSQATLPL